LQDKAQAEESPLARQQLNALAADLLNTAGDVANDSKKVLANPTDANAKKLKDDLDKLKNQVEQTLPTDDIDFGNMGPRKTDKRGPLYEGGSHNKPPDGTDDVYSPRGPDFDDAFKKAESAIPKMLEAASALNTRPGQCLFIR
jgi:hypothetical protein